MTGGATGAATIAAIAAVGKFCGAWLKSCCAGTILIAFMYILCAGTSTGTVTRNL